MLNLNDLNFYYYSERTKDFGTIFYNYSINFLNIKSKQNLNKN